MCKFFVKNRLKCKNYNFDKIKPKKRNNFVCFRKFYLMHFIRSTEEWNINHKSNKYRWHCRSKPHQTTSYEMGQCDSILHNNAAFFFHFRAYPSACRWHIPQLPSRSATTVMFPRVFHIGLDPSSPRQGGASSQICPATERTTEAASHTANKRPGPRMSDLPANLILLRLWVLM